MFCCIFIPDFIVEAVLRAEPMLRGQATAVIEGKPPLCYVVATNEAARHLGVEVGMTKLLAETLKASGEGERSFEQRTTKNEERGTTQEPAAANRKLARRPHSQGAYESVYGRMDTRFGLYRTRLEADELQANDPSAETHQATSKFQPKTPPKRRGEKLDREGPGWSHEITRQGSFVPETKGSSRAVRSVGLTLRQRSAAQEESAHAALLDAAHAVSPKVEDSAPDTVLLDVSGLDRLFGTPQQVAQELLRRLTDVGLIGNVAIAGNPDAAEHAARGFPGVTILAEGREFDRLGTLPLEVLFAAERSAVARTVRRREEQRKAAERFTAMQETLDRWGIRNFRGLASLPPVSLSERLGTNGVRLQTLASGAAQRELLLAEPGLHFEESVELDYPVDVLEPLAFLISRMLESVCARLAARALSTNELRLRMKLEHRTGDEAAKSQEELKGDPLVERKLTLPVPMNEPRLFLKLLQIELSANPPGAPVTQLWLEAEAARPRVGQAGLFQPLAPEVQKLELTLARMHKLLGVRDQIRAGAVTIVDTHQPDSFQVQRFQPAEEELNSRRRKRAPRGDDNEKPGEKNEEQYKGIADSEFGALSLRRFRPPLSAEVDLRDGVPVRVICNELGAGDSLQANIIWAAGPWRSSGNWWEGKRIEIACEPQTNKDAVRAVIRSEERKTKNDEPVATHWNTEEWDVALALSLRETTQTQRTTQVSLYRLVRDCESQRWCVEAGYD